MYSNKNTGQQGEALAARYFLEKGYELLHQNWRHKRLEVDIIAVKNTILHFIEVKTRTSLRFGFPEEKVDSHKIRHLIDASSEYLFQNPQWKRIQIDILSITLINQMEPEYFLIEDVYL